MFKKVLDIVISSGSVTPIEQTEELFKSFAPPIRVLTIKGKNLMRD